MNTPHRKHVEFWLHYYLRLYKRAQSPPMKRAALIRLRYFQQEARTLLKPSSDCP